MIELSTPGGGRSDIRAWVARELSTIVRGPVAASDIVGGQRAADAALASFDVSGYARRRNEVWPAQRRGASGLSPYIRHGLLTLPRVWRAVADGPAEDVARFRDELLWQEYARHVYARLGTATRRSLRYAVAEFSDAGSARWDDSPAACLTMALAELRQRGWLPNQARMWLASHWSVRNGYGWREGEDDFFRHLLDGSRAANRVGWQWTVGALTGKPYGFSRWQVEKRAPGLCRTCALQEQCPIQEWPAEQVLEPRPLVDPAVRRDPDPAATAGPRHAEVTATARAVWITAESLGADDPALMAHPDLPAIFVFDEPLLRRLRLASARVVFLAEALADLASHRPLEVWLGDPAEVLRERELSATFAPVPGWRRLAARIAPVDVRPWPWLVPPHAGPLTSFTAWRRASSLPRGAG